MDEAHQMRGYNVLGYIMSIEMVDRWKFLRMKFSRLPTGVDKGRKGDDLDLG